MPDEHRSEWGGGAAPEDSTGHKNLGARRMKQNIRLSLAFELAPNAVTFSFLAALKKEARRKCRL